MDPLPAHAEIQTQSSPTCPSEDCALLVDIVLQSSDGVKFGAHTKNLADFSEGFPWKDSVVVDEDPLVLEESADVLKLMLQFMHHAHHPSLGEVSFTVLSSLAEAVEKYTIFSAIELCKVYMTLQVERYPLDVLMYAIRHDYPKIANQAAPFTLSRHYASFMLKAKSAGLRESDIIRWFCYRDICDDVRRTVLRSGIRGSHQAPKGKPQPPKCTLWESFEEDVLRQARMIDFYTQRQLDDILDQNASAVKSCTYCRSAAHAWEWKADEEFRKIPLFCNVQV